MKRFHKLSLLFSCLLLGTPYFHGGDFPGFAADKKAEAIPEGNTDSFAVKLIDLGANGDCTLITYQDTQILIDCGGTSKSWGKIEEELNKAFPKDSGDKVLDYVIFSHGDDDHIVNFANDVYKIAPSKLSITADKKGCLATWLVKKKYSIGTFIDFDPSCDPTLTDIEHKDSFYAAKNDDTNPQERSTSYQNYKNARDYLKKNNYIKEYVTNSQCLSSFRDDLTKGKGHEFKNEFVFSQSPLGKITILDNYYAYHSILSGAPNELSRNVIATCALIEFDDYKYLFTGDLPEFKSSGSRNRASSSRKEIAKAISGMSPGLENLGPESLLVERNYEKLKDGVLFFKAGHHGSFTSNSDNLLNVIRPQYIGVSCAAGGQYNFPKDLALTAMCQYTDKVYLTSYKDSEGASKPLHGTVIFSYNRGNDCDELSNVTYGNSSEPKSILKSNRLWYLADDKKNTDSDNKKARSENRRFPIRTIELSSAALGVTPNDCTYIKAGHFDVLINDGALRGKKDGCGEINEKIERLCNDHVLDYLIISSQQLESFSNLIGQDGLLSNPHSSIKRINHLIVNPICGKDLEKNAAIESLKKGIRNSCIEIKKMYGIDSKGFASLEATRFPLSYGMENLGYLQLLARENASTENCAYDTSLGVNVNLMDGFYNYLNLGACYNSAKNLDLLSRYGLAQGTDENASNGKSSPITLMTLPHFGYLASPDEARYINALNKSSTYFGVLVNAPFGSINSDGKSLYPSSGWKKTCLFQGRSFDKSTGCLRTNKFVNKRSTNVLNLIASYIDIEAIANYPAFSKENLQYRYGCDDFDGRYFSFYNLRGSKLSDYTKAFLKTMSQDGYSSYLYD